MLKKIIIARHHGFCMGVKRAINIAEETAQKKTGPVAILNEIVHNEAVVERFRGQGVGQAFSVEEVSDGTLIISAHGVAPAVIEKAQSRGLNVVDATCPLVTRIYDIVTKIIANGYYVIHFGDRKHDETEGVVGHAPDRITVVSSKDELSVLPEWTDRKLGLTSQTTASQEAFAEFQRLAKQKWPHLEVFDTICNATSQRQSAMMDLAPQVDMVIVVGSRTSANSLRLVDIARAICGKAYLVGSERDIKDEWLATDQRVESVGVSAGASTPEFLVEAVINCLRELSGGSAEVIVPERRDRIRNSSRKAV
ncbi:MAG: 4-hydroxy-3-methylbut-2-enyl diphosphate reductase [Candidatus Zixiibacteriota bacterium]